VTNFAVVGVNLAVLIENASPYQQPARSLRVSLQTSGLSFYLGYYFFHVVFVHSGVPKT
jgi:hypothetical protein